MRNVYSLYFRRKGRCVEKNFISSAGLVNYIMRYIGDITDFCCYPSSLKNADKVVIFAGDAIRCIVYCPPGDCSSVERAICLFTFLDVMGGQK